MVKILRTIGADAFILIILIGLLALLSLLIAKQTTDETERPHRTVSSPTPSGWKAIYLLLKERNAKDGKLPQVTVTNHPPREWTSDIAVIVTGDEYKPQGLGDFSGDTLWTKQQAEDAVKWVKQGGTLILFQSEESSLAETLNLQLVVNGVENGEIAPTQPTAALSGVRKIQVPGTAHWANLPKQAISLFKDKYGDTVSAFKRGSGRIIAVSDAGILDNGHLLKADNARFAAQLLSLTNTRTGTICFDEYHQGFASGDSLWRAMGRAGQLTFWQCLGVVLLFTYSASRRFGLAIPLRQASRVSSEYVSSLADLYRRAQARQAALESIYTAFRADLCHSLSLPNDAPLGEVKERSANYYQTIAALPVLLQKCEDAINGEAKDFGEKEMVSLVREIEAMRKETGLGRDRNS